MDRLLAMNTFLAVVDTGGFAPAARKLRVSPPVVTRAVAELEERLGVQLLVRTTRVVRVTETGARYAEDCRRLLAGIADAEETATGTHLAPRGQLSVTASVLFGSMFVTPIMTAYLERYPQVEATCWFLDRVVNLVDEGMDVAVRIGELPDSSLQAIRVGHVRRVLCAAPAYLEQAGTPQSIEELEQHTVISATGITPHNDWRFMRDDQHLTTRVTPRLTVNTNDAAVTAAKAGFGITRLMSYQVAAHLRDGSLVCLLDAFEPAPLPVNLVHREGRHASHRVRSFLDMAISALRSDALLNLETANSVEK
jgi:DNA-binding transcriptional LysR family regulator